MQGGFKSDRAAKTEFEAQLDEFFSLLVAAVEGMRNTVPAAARSQLTQMFEQSVSRAAHMQANGRLGVFGRLGLFPVE